MPDISIIVPVYKEEGNIRPFLSRTKGVLQEMGLDYEIIFCLDPSPDATESIIISEAEKNSNVKMIKFSRRFGQPVATITGINYCQGKTCLVIDVDMQDPPELIKELYGKLQEGYDVVCAKRRKREGESWVKLLVSHVGYRIINTISDVEIPPDTGDFRIMSRRVVDHLKQLGEQNCFLRGMVAFVGFKQAFVEYDRLERYQGKGNYNRYLGSLKIGLNGIVSFSSVLLSMTSLVGIATVLVSLAIICYYVITKLFFNYPYPMGTPTIIILVLFIGGVQLLSIGLLGEYIGRIYDEVKRRPRSIISETVNMGKAEP